MDGGNAAASYLIRKAIATIRIARIMEIQIGDRTHNQDQAITPHSFSTMKTMVSSPVKPMPVEEDLLSIFFSFLVLGVFLLLFDYTVIIANKSEIVN